MKRARNVGAGRKASGKRIAMMARIEVDLMEKLRAESESTGAPMNWLVNKAIRDYLRLHGIGISESDRA